MILDLLVWFSVISWFLLNALFLKTIKAETTNPHETTRKKHKVFCSMLQKSFPLFILLSAVLMTAPISAQTKRRPAAKPTPGKTTHTIKSIAPLTPEQQKRLAAFDMVWKTIKDNYFDQTFNGLNWDDIRKEYQSKALKAAGSLEFHTVLQDMISRLNRSHFVIVPPEVYRELEKAKDQAREKDAAGKEEEDGEGEEPGDKDHDEFFLNDDDAKFGIGIDIRMIGSQVVITGVEEASAADKAGLKPGFVIDKVNDVSLKELLQKMLFAGSYGKLTEKVFPMAVLGYFINGEKESSVLIDYLDDKDKPQAVIIKRERLNGRLIKPVPNFPRQFFSFESRSLNADTGYLRFNMFAMPAVEGICGALREFKDKKAVIIDLRGNIGGSIGAMIGIVGLLIDKPVILGTQIFKSSKEPILVRPQGRKYDGKLIVLVDSMSHSAAEIFAGGLQENGGLKVVGEKSAGQALPSTTVVLSTGALFMYPYANFQTPGGNFIEGNGVEPDVKVPRERKTLLEGKDSQLDAAVALLKVETEKTPERPEREVFKAAGPQLPPLPTKAQLQDLIKLGSPLKAPAAAAKIEKKYDEQALKIINEFIAAAGGEQAWKKIKSYSAAGKVEIMRAGTKVEGDIQLIGKSPDKSAEIMSIEAVGEVRGIFDGKKYYLQSDLTGNSEYNDSRQVREMGLAANLQEMLRIKDIYSQVIYIGEYQRKGKTAALVKAVTADGIEVAFAFDTASKLLVQRIGTFTNSSYDDYRKVGDVMVPFWQTRSDAMKIKLSEFKLNVPVEDSFFVPKDNCFSAQKQ